MQHARFIVILGALCLGACGGSDDGTTTPPVDPANSFLFTTAEFSLEAGEEKFLCHAITLEEDLVIDRFSFPGAPHVHHLILSETISPEPDGLTECDVLFRPTWLPLFVAGTGKSTIDAPEGSGYHIVAGTQLVLQLHLLNVQPTPVTDTVTVDMRETEELELDSIGIKVFGNLAIALPPNSPSEVVGSCTLKEDWEVFAVFPHMHYMGTSMVVESGPTEDSLEEVFRRDPYDFDDQRLDAQPIWLPKGHHVRVTCQFDNTTDDVITFGESTGDEMCFFLVYGAGVETDLGGCLGGGGSGSSFLPAGCGDEPPNNLGLGAACSPKGDECNDGLSCSADLIQSGDDGVCLSLGQCETATDCGDGEAMCCSLEFGDSPFKLCLAKGCGIPGCNFL
jgi:hypothetical protein